MVDSAREYSVSERRGLRASCSRLRDESPGCPAPRRTLTRAAQRARTNDAQRAAPVRKRQQWKRQRRSSHWKERRSERDALDRSRRASTDRDALDRSRRAGPIATRRTTPSRSWLVQRGSCNGALFVESAMSRTPTNVDVRRTTSCANDAITMRQRRDNEPRPSGSGNSGIERQRAAPVRKRQQWKRQRRSSHWKERCSERDALDRSRRVGPLPHGRGSCNVAFRAQRVGPLPHGRGSVIPGSHWLLPTMARRWMSVKCCTPNWRSSHKAPAQLVRDASVAIECLLIPCG